MLRRIKGCRRKQPIAIDAGDYLHRWLADPAFRHAVRNTPVHMTFGRDEQ